jgi:uncharacterized protein (DUF433 family)
MRYKEFRGTPMPVEDSHSVDLSRIVSDPGVCGGRPRVRGTRVRVVDILELLASGMERADILREFPYLTSEDISAALLYSARSADHRTYFVS